MRSFNFFTRVVVNDDNLDMQAVAKLFKQFITLTATPEVHSVEWVDAAPVTIVHNRPDGTQQVWPPSGYHWEPENNAHQ